MQASETQSISIGASREAVLELVGDPLALPRWAPDFASAIRPQGEDWIVDNGAGELRIRVRVSREYGTVDFLAAGLADGVEVGAFSRVLPAGAGSTYMFTRFYAPDAEESDIARQRTIVREELERVRELVEP